MKRTPLSAMLSRIDRLSFAISPAQSFKIGEERKWLAVISFLVLLTLTTLYTTPPTLPDYATVRASYKPSEAYLYDARGQLLDAERVDFTIRRLAWVPLADVSPVLPQALIAAEDKRFNTHHGVDWRAVGAAALAKFSNKKSRGASTISMQLVGLLEPSLALKGPHRSPRQKIMQARAAIALENNWAKPQIMEAYLNLLGFRGELQGVGAASRVMVGKSPASLSTPESQVLASLLPAPQASAQNVAARACRIAAAKDCGIYTDVAAQMLDRHGRGGDPALALQLAARLLTRSGQRITTTLDADIQRLATQALTRQLGRLSAQAARDGAVVVLENTTGNVLAWVGGAGPNSRAAAVDNARAYRQAGSTLKPFLYADAIEHKYLTAASLLDDSPVHLDTASGLYIPQNYDRSFKGPVSVRTALGNSLNVPAVRTLLLVGVDSFRDRLFDLGYAGLTQDGDFYGYSLALGSAEVTLAEQANAYRTLANGGRWQAIRIRATDPVGTPKQIIDSSAAAIVADILADPTARSLTFGTDSQLALPFWAAVKTGTSKAMRDNWCIGFSDRFTIGVWVGNAEGDAMRNVSGVTGAAPVWRELMLALHAGNPGEHPALPAGIVRSDVRFNPAFEPPRRELFLSGTAQTQMQWVADNVRRAKIVNPVAGTIFALDPDIPGTKQTLQLRSVGAPARARFMLDAIDVGPANASPLWHPLPGAHRLILRGYDGKTLDSALFHVR